MKRSRIKPISDKRRERMKAYKLLREAFLKIYPICEVCLNAKATDIHHRRGRFGSRLNETEHWLPVCRKCHTLIHHNPKWAYEQGHLLKK
jgi:hypothetical protein